ncbi:MAG: BrnT family toxin [Syntrophobacteraceae bacterium]
MTVFDPDHSEEEDRFITFGFSASGRLLMVAHTDRRDRIRILSVRGRLLV